MSWPLAPGDDLQLLSRDLDSSHIAPGLSAHHRARAVLVVALILATFFRVSALSTYGFSEDEAAKLRAIDAYRHGDLSANAEHPMLMKVAMWASLSAAGQWNQFAGPRFGVPEETALRLPNALAGVVTVAAVYGVAELLFGPAVAATAAIIVALDPNVTASNRIGKEDTFLLMFFFIAVWCYERAKRIGVRYLPRAKQWYTLSGIAFGLMLASKYMPHLLGLYAVFNVVVLRNAGPNCPDKPRYYGAMVLSFIAGNCIILAPSTWAYCLAYVQGDGLTHHGFLYAHHLYTIDALISPDGVPLTYYLRLFATKVPLIVLAGAVVGLVPLMTRGRERGFAWLRIMLIPLLLSYSLVAVKFQRYALPMLLLIDMVAAVGLVAAGRWLCAWPRPRAVRIAVTTTGALVFTGLLLAAQMGTAPFYSFYQNALGARLDPPASVFPEEAYDYGVREAVAAITAVASPGAVIVGDTPGAITRYVARSGRSDLQVWSLSRRGTPVSGERWVLAQDSHLTFENALLVDQLRRRHAPWREYRARGAVVLQVYRLSS